MTIETEFMFEMQGRLAQPIEIGQGPEGIRTILPIAEGTVKGPALAGKVMPMTGADWARVRPDGTLALDVRLAIEAENGDLIFMTYGGRISADTDAGMEAALDFAKPDPSTGENLYYFRTNPVFETASETYSWLNRIVAIGSGRTGAGGVTYQIYKIK